jgi:spore maturation protein SpmB
VNGCAQFFCCDDCVVPPQLVKTMGSAASAGVAASVAAQNAISGAIEEVVLLLMSVSKNFGLSRGNVYGGR